MHYGKSRFREVLVNAYDSDMGEDGVLPNI